MLQQKKVNTNADWLNTYENITEIISEQEVNEAEAESVAFLKEHATGKTFYGWSGGKDSIVLTPLCKQAGIEDCAIVTCPLEYPAFDEWIDRNAPPKLQRMSLPLDLDWLAKHEEMLFPTDGYDAVGWDSRLQSGNLRKYAKANDYSHIVLGRRRHDGNQLRSRSNTYTTKDGVTSVFPIADWSNELLLAYIVYRQIPMPPIYDWKDGFVHGTHVWPRRERNQSIQHTWQEIYDIDPSIVHEASAYLNSAADYLRSV